MQEAYRPLCSKYSLCCPDWVPPPARVPPRAGPGRVSPPCLDLAGYPPSWTWQGTPPAGPGRVPPRLDLAGYPPGCPMAFWEMLQSIMEYGYPPQCGQTENITFPLLQMWAVIKFPRTTYAVGHNKMWQGLERGYPDPGHF